MSDFHSFQNEFVEIVTRILPTDELEIIDILESFDITGSYILDIPSHIDGYPVSRIDENSLSLCNLSCHTLIVPETIKSIPDMIMCGLNYLKTIIIKGSNCRFAETFDVLGNYTDPVKQRNITIKCPSNSLTESYVRNNHYCGDFNVTVKTASRLKQALYEIGGDIDGR